MREIIIKYLKGEQITINEAISLIEEYMNEIGKYNNELIQQIINPMNPFGRGMLEQAITASIKHLSAKYEICKLYNKDNQLLMVF